MSIVNIGTEMGNVKHFNSFKTYKRESITITFSLEITNSSQNRKFLKLSDFVYSQCVASFFQVPYQSLSSVPNPCEHDRTKLISFPCSDITQVPSE